MIILANTDYKVQLLTKMITRLNISLQHEHRVQTDWTVSQINLPYYQTGSEFQDFTKKILPSLSR